MNDRNATDAFWQSVINSIPDPVFVKDQQHRWIALNAAFCEFIGRTREELIGKSDYDFLPKAEADEFWAVDEIVFQTEQQNENEEVLTGGSGERHFVATKKAMFRTPSGEKVLVGVIRDISARRRAKEALEELNQSLEEQVAQRTADLEERARSLAESERAMREQSHVLESILKSLASGVLVVDSEGKLLLQNPAVERLIGRVPSGVPFFSWLAQRASGSARAIVSTATPGTQIDIDEMLFSDESSMRIRWIAMTSRPLLHDEGGPRGTVVVLRDVSLRRKAEEELRASEQRLLESQKMEAVGRLAGGVAHDFNNLLLVIGGCATIIDRQVEENSPLRADLDQITHAVDRAAGLTRQLLAFGKRQVVNPRLTDLGEVVRGMEEMLNRLLGKGAELECRIAPDLPPAFVDRGQMEQVLMNLVINAGDATTPGGKIDIALEAGDIGAKSELVLTVSDTGSGMDEETRLRAFEPFFSTKTGEGNSGLGLATVYGIVRQMGGEVTVESLLGQGSVFRVAIPAVSGREKAAPQTDRSGGQATYDGSEYILLVEDDDNIRDLITRVLCEHGYIVLSCRNGEEALHAGRAHGGTIDLLLADVIMPGLTGPQVAEILESERPDMRSLFMSGYSDRELDRHLASGKGLDFIQKPFALTVLMREIRAILDRPARRLDEAV